MAKNPYDILGVSKTASDAEIKAAYRKLAKKYHPDVNPGDEEALRKFKDAGTAYDFLKDKDKRAAFDRGDIDIEGQPAWGEFGGAAGGKRPNFRDFSGNFSGGPNGAQYYSSGSVNPEDLQDIFGSFFGGAGFGRTRPGAGPGFGAGFEEPLRTQPNADINYRLEVDFLDAARGAKQQVTMPDGKNLAITIPAGVREGQKLRLKGKGRALPGGKSGDAYVEIHIRPHNIFTRSGNDIHSEVPIGLHEAVLGGKIEVETIHGPVQMSVPKGTSSGTQLRLKGKGIKDGSHIARVRIVMPPQIDPELEEAIKNWAAKHAYNPRRK